MSWLSLSTHTFVTGISIVSGVCVFVTVNPLDIEPSIDTWYSFGTVVSLTVYTISLPSLFFGNSLNIPLQLFELFNVNVFPITGLPSAYNCTVIDNGLIPSWLLLSSHTLTTGISIVSWLCVFVIVNPLVTEPLIVVSYPSIWLLSLTVYFISVPFLYFGKSLNEPFHPFDEFSVNVFPLTGLPSSYNCTVIDSGLIPSWSLLSAHIFVTGMSIVSGVCVFVIVKPFVTEPSTDDV